AEDGIRYFHVTGVQTCALPILPLRARECRHGPLSHASCAERYCRAITFAWVPARTAPGLRIRNLTDVPAPAPATYANRGTAVQKRCLQKLRLCRRHGKRNSPPFGPLPLLQ